MEVLDHECRGIPTPYRLCERFKRLTQTFGCRNVKDYTREPVELVQVVKRK